MNNDSQAYEKFLTENFGSEFIKRLERLEEQMYYIEQDDEFELITEGPGSMFYTDYYETEMELDGLYEAICEKNRDALKYIYRIGIDLDTGKQVAIKFRLESESAAASGSRGMATNLTLIRNPVQKFTHMDYTTSPMTVVSIFHQDGNALQSVRMIGALNKPFQECLTDKIESYHISKDGSDSEKQGDRKYKSTLLMWNKRS